MATPPPDDAISTFDQLRTRFLTGLQARWQEIDAAEGPVRRAALHRLAGAAGSYGFADLGQAAREAERVAATGDGAALRDRLTAAAGEASPAARLDEAQRVVLVGLLEPMLGDRPHVAH